MSRRPQQIDYSVGFLKAARSGNLDQVLEYLKWNIDVNVGNANGLTALHLASKEGHDHVVSELIRRRANVEAQTRKGNTPLHVGALGGHEPAVRILVENGANINAKSQDGFTPLYMAAQENHLDVVKYLLDRGADHTLVTRDGYTPLAVALQLGHDDIVGVLMDQDTVMQTKTKLPPLHRAAKKDDYQGALNLLQKERQSSSRLGGGIVNEITKSGFTPLHTAAHHGNTRVGRVLIENGADIDFKAKNMVTPLHVASKWGRHGMVQLLLDSGANLACLTKDELTPLHCAARSGHDNVASILLQRGAQVGAKSKSRLSPLHMSAQGDHVECADLFLGRNAPIDDVTIDYLTPLHVTAHCGSVKTCRLLLDRKCEVNARALNGFTPLHIACKKNRIKIIELLLRYGGVIESTTETGLTPLHVASFMGHMSIVKLLLENGADPNTANERGETSLHLAARGDQTEVMAVLLDSGAQADAKAKELQTALHIAARQGNAEAVDLLLKRGASPNNATKDLYTPLHIAVREGHVDIAKMLLDRDANPGLTTKKGFTPLHIAAKHGQPKLVQLLLQRGVHPDIKGRNDLTPLHVATHYGNADIVNYLLNKGASAVPSTKNGYTPLHIAAKKDHTDIASTLMERGAKPGCESRNGFTPLHLAAKEGHVRMVKLLFSRGADANCRAKNGLTPMHLAAQEDHVPVAELLVKHNAQIDPPTKAGYTPLHTACHFGQINMIQFLLEHGASVNATTKVGNTPLHQAAQQGHVMVINLLLRYRANPNAVNATGQTPLSIAQHLGFLSVVETLNKITEVVVTPNAMAGRYKRVVPETMQESTMIELDEMRVLRSKRSGQAPNVRNSFHGEDGEDESFRNGAVPGSDTLPSGGHQYLSVDDGRPRSASPTFRDDSDIFGFDKTLDRYGSMSFCDYHALEDEMKYMREPMASAVDELADQYAGTMPMSVARQTKTRAPPPEQFEKAPMQFAKQPEMKTLTRRPPGDEDVSPDFLADANGGVMEGTKPAGVRIIVPPGAVSAPTRFACRLIRVEKLKSPPSLLEGEDLATRILEMEPIGSKFNRPILVDVPHFASLRGREREILVLRCDDGKTWQEHVTPPGVSESDVLEIVKARFKDVEHSDELYKKRISRILATDLPQYFALVTRVTKDQSVIDSRGGTVVSSNSPQVKVTVPNGSLTRSTKMGLQIQPISEDVIAKKRPSSRSAAAAAAAAAASPIVTVEPRRYKFNKPLTVTMPLPAKRPHSDTSTTLRLLRNSSDGKVPAQWEDITATTPLTILNDTATFSTPTSASFWLLDCQSAGDSTRLASELYPEAILVPFMAKFVVCGRRHLPTEARLRVFCMTGDVLEKTIKRQGRFKELARSREVEVLNKTPQYLELDGNLEVVKKSKKQPSVFFRALRANGVPVVVRIRNTNEDPTGRLAFMQEQILPKGQGHRVQDPVCSTIVTLPVDVVPDAPGEAEDDEDLENRIPGDESPGSSGESRESSVPVSGDELSPEDRAALRKKMKTYASDLESEPDIIDDQNGRFKRQEPGNTELFVNTSPVKIDFIPDDKAYASFSVPTDTARILTRPEAKASKTIDGGTRLVTDVKEQERIREDGFTIKERITTTKHLKTVTEIALIDGVPSDSQTKETLILTEIEENISELPPGITSLLSPDIQTETTEKDLQSTLPDGSLVKKKTIRTVGRLKPVAPKRGHRPEEKGPKVTKELVEGDFIPRSKVEESHKTRGDGVTEKLKVVTTQYFKPITEITFTDGVETDRQSSERLDNVNIEENILELPSGVIAPNADNCDTDISIDTKEYTMPDGTPVKKRTVRMIVTLKGIPEKQVSVQRTEGDIRSVSDVVTDQENMDKGRKARKRKLITTRHYKPITEVTFTDGVPSEPVTHEEFLGADIDENILELSAGVIEPYAENCDTKISLESCEFSLDEGAPAKKTLVTMTVAPKPLTSDVAVSIVEGPIEPRSETRISEGKLTNGGTVRRKIVKTTFVNPVREVTVVDGVSKSRLIREEVVGVEVVENVLEMPPGITEPNGKNVTTKTTMTKSEETLPNGKVAKKKIIRTVAELAEETITYDDSKPVAARRKGKSPSGQASDDVIADNLTRRTIEGEIEPRVDVVEDEQKLDNGVIRKRKVVTTRFIKPLYEITLTNGMPPESQKIEEVVNAEIRENILELDYGVVDSNAANCDADISVAKTEVQLPEGVPAKKKTTKITVRLPEYGKKEATDYAKRRKQLPKENRQLIEGDIQLRPTVSESRQTLSDGGTVQQRIVTTKHIKPVTEIITKEGRPPQKKEWEELVATDIEENVLRLPAGVIEPDALNCDIDVSVDKSQITLPDGNLANKTATEIVVKLRDPTQPPREKWRKRKTGDKDKAQQGEDVIEGPIEQRTEVKNYQVTRKDGGDTLYKVVTTSCHRPIFKVSTVGGTQSKTKLREDLVSIDIVENILELPAGVTDINRIDVKTDTNVTFDEETLPDGVPVRKRVVRTVGVLLTPAELSSIPAQQKKVPDAIRKVIEGEIEPRTETEKDEQNLNDGTTIARKTITTKYVKPTIEVKIARGQSPESTAKEEVVRADISENILELPCGVIEPYGENCEADISEKDSEETSPENVPLKKKTRRMVVKLIPEGGKEGVPLVTKQRIEGEIEDRPSTVEDKEDLNDGGTVWRKVATTKHVKPVTEITSTNGIPTDTKKWEELVGTDVEENILQLPVGVIEPNSSNCDIDVNVEKTEVTLPDGSQANKVTIRTVVKLRDAFQPPKRKGKKRNWKPRGKGAAAKRPKGMPDFDQEHIIEGPIESRTDVNENEVKGDDGGIVKYRVVTTTNVRIFFKVVQKGGNEEREKFREEVDSKEIVENILVMPPGVTDVKQRNVKTNSTVRNFEETLPEGIPLRKTVVKTVATLLGPGEQPVVTAGSSDESPGIFLKSVEGEIEPRIEVEEDENNLPDGTTLKRSKITTKYVQPVTEIRLVSGLPPESTVKETVVDADINENILELPCGLIEPFGENCATDFSEAVSDEILPDDNVPAKKKTTTMVVTLRPPGEDGKTKAPNITKKLKEGDVISRFVMAEEKENHDDGGSTQRKSVTVRHFKPFADITYRDGIPISTKHWEELVGIDIEENVLKLPAGVVEPNASNCDIDISVEKSQVLLPDGRPANKTVTTTAVLLRDPELPPRQKRQKRKRRPGRKGDKLPPISEEEEEPDLIEGPIEKRSEVKEYETKGRDGGLIKYRVVTTISVRPILKVSKVGGKEVKTKVREKLDSKDIVENILELPPGVTDISRPDVKTDTTVLNTEDSLPGDVPVTKKTVRTVALLLTKAELAEMPVRSSGTPGMVHKVLEGEIEPRTEIEEDEQNLNDGTTVAQVTVTTRYVKPVTEVRLVSGQPPESTTREEIQRAEVSENILELPCGVIDPFASNCDRDIAVTASEVVLPEGTPAKKTTTRMVVQLRQPVEGVVSDDKKRVPATYAEKPGVPQQSTKVLEGEIEARSETSESQKTLDDGSTVTHRVVITRYVKPITEVVSVDGVTTEEKHREELVGTDIDETVTQLPVGVIEPNSRNCDVDVTVDTSRVTLLDGSPANRVVTKMIVKLRDPRKPKREKLKKRKYKPGKKHALKEKAGVQNEDTIEGPIEARTEVQEYEVATKDGGLRKHRVVTTTKVKSILKVSKVGTVETKTKLREEVDSVQIIENILELPSGVTDVSQKDVTTDTTLTSAEETLPDGVPVTKKVVRTVARLLTEPEIAANAELNELPDNALKVIEGEVEPRQEVEEDEQNLNDGRTIRQIVVTTKYVKPITEVRISGDGPPKSSTREEIVDADVSVNIFDLPSGVISPNASNCQQDTSVDKSEVFLPDGTPATKKTSKTVISLRPPGSTPREVVPHFTDKPSELTRKITEGEITSKSVTAEDQESLEEGGTQKRKIITTTYVKPITEQIVQDGLTLETNTFEEVVGTDIEENILRLPAGKIEPNAANCETDLSIDAFEIDLPDGNVARKFFAMLVVKLKGPQDAKTPSAKKPISSTDGKPGLQNIIEGPIQSRTDSKTFQEASPKGGIVMHNVVTTTYLKPIIEVTTVKGIGKRNVLKEETVNLEIVENILELPPGMKEFDSRNAKADTTVNTSEDSLPNGTPVTKRIVKTVVLLPTEPLAGTDHEAPSVIHKVIDGEIRSKSEVVENQQNLDNGRAIIRKVATTRQVKPVTEVKLAKGCPPESTTREETVAVDVREHILELPSGVIEPNAKNCDIDITVDKTDDLTPGNVPTKQKTVSMKVNLRPSSVGKKFPQVRIIEGDVRVSKTVKEFEENLDNGAVAKHKIITTRSVKPITEITSLDGLTVETRDREEIVGTEIEENILQLPTGVIEPNASNCVADLSVNTSDVVLPDGNLARKTTIKVIVQLKKPSSLTAATDPELLAKLAEPGEEVKIIDGDIVTKTDVTGHEEVTDDGTTVKSRVITMTHSRPIIQIVTANGEEKRTILREETTGVDVIENILKLLPGVTDPRDAGVKTTTSIKTCRETLPTGVPVQRETIETVASPPKKDQDPGLAGETEFWPQETADTPDVTLRILEGPVEAKSEVKEDQRNLDDGRTIKQKSVTTRYVKPVTEVIMVDDNAPESTTKEELVKGDVKQIILDLPCGTIEPFGKNCETDITVEDTSVMLPEKRAVPKKIVKMTVQLAEPPSTTGVLEPRKPRVTKKLVEGEITSKSNTTEDEQTLSDGTVVRQKIITTQFFKPVTEITLVDGEPTDSVERVELVDCIIDETVLQLSPGVIEPNASNCETDISFVNSEIVLPDGTKAKKRLTRIVVRIKESLEEEIIDGQFGRTKIVEGPVEQKTKVYKDEKKIEDGSTVRRKVITTRHVKPVLEVVVVNGKQASSRLREERLVLTEIEENILQLPPGIKDVYGSNVQTKSTATDFEDAASDGSPIKRKVIKTVAYVAEGPEAVLATAEGLPTNQVIEGPIQSRTTVKEDQKDMDDGVTRKSKVVTTVYFRPFTEVILSEGSAPDSQVREEVIRTLIDECILELPAGVIEPFAKNCDTEIKVDNLEYTALDGSPVIKKVVLMTVTLKKEFLEEMARKDTSIRPTGSSRQPKTKLIEGEIEPRTKVAEEQDNFPNGVTLKKKFITTTYVKPVTEIVVDDGGVEISRNFKEIVIGVDKEEHTLELPCGVIEPYASNCDTNISVTNSKETQADGIVANKKVVKMTVTLKETAPFEEEEEDTAKPKKPRGKKVLEGPVEPRVSIRQKQETKDDGTKTRSKITTTQYFKSVTEIPVIDGVESEGKTKEVPVSIEIVTDVLQIHPSVTEPYVEQATESNVTVKHSEEISADGLPVRQTIKTTVVTPKTPGFAKPVVKEVTHETVNGDIRSQASVAEDEKDLDDGSTIRRKVITTIYIIPITELTLVNGVETEATTKEEVVRAEIEEHVLQLPTGLIEPHADNCDIDISVRTFDDRLPDGAPAKKKLVSTVVKLKESAGLSVQSQKTIEGNVRTVKDVAEDEKVTEEGWTIRTRTVTTKWLKLVTDVSSIRGIEVKSKTREVVVRTEIEENILELSPNVKDETRSDLESQTSVEQGEVVLPDGTVAQRITTRTTVSERSADSKSTHTTLEGPIELQKTETQDQKNLDDGVTVRRKVVTTKKIKKMTDITLANGVPTESKIREVLLGVDIEEHILQLPPGVIEPFGSNCDTNISVEESEEELPAEGVTAKKKVVTMVVTLKPQEREIDTSSPVRASKHVSFELLLSPEDRTSTPDDVFLRDRLSERTIEKQIEVRKKVTEDQKNLDDGSTLRRKVITSDYIKPIWKVSLVNGKEVESFVREELVNTEIEEHVLQLPPGVIEPFGSNCETEISVESSEVTLPDGRVAKKKLVRMIVFLKTSEPADKRVSVTEEKPTAADERDHASGGLPKVTHRIEEGQISSLVKVTETQQVLEDGSTVRRKVITTKFIRPVTDTTLVDGVETGTETREENIRTEIEEITLKLPAGVIEPYGSNLETETTVDQFDDTLPDGTPAKKKLVTIVVHLKEPVQPEKRDSVSDDKSKQADRSVTASDRLDESKRKGRDDESAGTVNKVIEGAVSVTTEVDEGEDALEDGTTIRRKTVTTRHFKPITKLTITDGVVTDAKMDEETVKMDIDETVLQLPPGVTDPKGDNLQTETTVRTSQETSSGGVVATRKVTKKVVSVKWPLVSKQKEPPERETKSFETHTSRKSARSDDVLRDKSGKPMGRKDERETTLTIRKRVRTKIRRVNPDGEIVEDEFTEEEDLSDVDPSSVMDLSPSIGSPTLISPSDSDVDSSAIKVYTDTVESDPVIERKVEEFEDTLPDGTLVRRRVIRTTQKKTIVKRVVMEGPEDELASVGEDQAKQLLVRRPGSSEPQLTRYTDVTKEEPETETDLKESEEVMPDGTVVKKRVKTTTQQKLTTERTVLGGTLDDNALREIFKEGGGGGAAGKALPTLTEEDRKSPKAKDKQDQKSGTQRKEQQERTSRLRLKKQVHKRTVVEPGREETVVVDKTRVDRSDDEPEELRDSIGDVIRELVGGATSGSSGDESL